jgi:phage terminase large subunit GpA-like protein
VHGRTIVAHAGAWVDLEQMLERTVRHAAGADLSIAGWGIDSGDGQTSEAVYSFVRKHHRQGRPIFATKGAPDSIGRTEIWTPPKRSVEPGKKSHGAAKAKDLVLGWAQHGGRVRLQGSGPGRMHWPDDVRPDFYEQLLGEMKIPSPKNPRIREWKERNDRRNEALDCTVGCVWLCRELKLHLLRAGQWDAIAARILRRAAAEAVTETATEPASIVPGGARKATKRAAQAPSAAALAPEPAKPAADQPPTQPAPEQPAARPTPAQRTRRIRGRMGGWRP